jgi:predicted RNase H-like HicB family nuclease
MRQVIIRPGEDGYYVAEVPSLPGCISQGESKEAALTNIREAIELYIAVLREDNLSVPEEHFQDLSPSPPPMWSERGPRSWEDRSHSTNL